MKKTILSLICCALVLLQPCVSPALADAHLSVAELAQSAPGYWDGAYTAHGREIAFHAPVYVPDVEQMPVITVTGSRVAEQDTVIPEGMILKRDDVTGQVFGLPQSLTHSVWKSRYFYLPWSEEGQAAAKETYAGNNELSLADAISDMELMVQDIWGTDVSVLPDRTRVCDPIERNGQYEDLSQIPGWGAFTGKGVYVLHGYLTLHGVPLLMGVSCGCEKENNVTYTALNWPALLEIVYYLDSQHYQAVIMDNLFKETGIAYEDIPLCPFDDIKAEVERLIEAGNIRDVFSIKLGYVVFQKPGESYNYKQYSRESREAEYLAVPTWVVECTYAKDAETKITTNPSDGNRDVPYWGDYGFKNLMINAQTGKAYDPYETMKSKQVYQQRLRAPEIATW